MQHQRDPEKPQKYWKSFFLPSHISFLQPANNHPISACTSPSVSWLPTLYSPFPFKGEIQKHRKCVSTETYTLYLMITWTTKLLTETTYCNSLQFKHHNSNKCLRNRQTRLYLPAVAQNNLKLECVICWKCAWDPNLLTEEGTQIFWPEAKEQAETALQKTGLRVPPFPASAAPSVKAQ